MIRPERIQVKNVKAPGNSEDSHFCGNMAPHSSLLASNANIFRLQSSSRSNSLPPHCCHSTPAFEYIQKSLTGESRVSAPALAPRGSVERGRRMQSKLERQESSPKRALRQGGGCCFSAALPWIRQQVPERLGWACGRTALPLRELQIS